MATITTPALILRRHPYSESSLVGAVLTRTQGRMDFLAKGCLREKSLLFGHLDLYQHEDLTLIERPQAGLDLLTEAAFVDEHAGLRFFPPAFAAAGFLADLALAACMPGDPHPDLFDSLAKSFRFLANLGEPAAKAGLAPASEMTHNDKLLLVGKILRYVIMETLTWFGFAPSLAACVVCGKKPGPESGHAVSRRHGGLVCRSCRPQNGGTVLSKNALAALIAAANGREYDENVLSGRERRELLRFLVDYCQYVVEKPLNSAKPLFQLLRPAEPPLPEKGK